ncbi:MAG: MoaD/ThiS family protein [Rhodanobacteraceae bacterium]
MNYRLLYFASLADTAGCGEEFMESAASNPQALYRELQRRHGFGFDPARLRVAVNGKLVDWNQKLSDADEIVFLPPVSGG